MATDPVPLKHVCYVHQCVEVFHWFIVMKNFNLSQQQADMYAYVAIKYFTI